MTDTHTHTSHTLILCPVEISLFLACLGSAALHPGTTDQYEERCGRHTHTPLPCIASV